MSAEILLALAGFAFAASITPGPNNIMVLSSGVNYGFRRTIPHMSGIVAGFIILLAGAGLGLGQVLERAPFLFTAIKFAGAAYLLYLAWRIANSGPIEAGDASARPMTFVEAALFQWVNPKAWVMAVTALTIYTNPANYMVSVIGILTVFSLITVPCVIVWCSFGVGLREWLSDPRRLKIFNLTMALLLVASLWPMLR